MTPRKILVIDFEPSRLRGTRELLEGAGYSCETVGSTTELSGALSAGLPPIVLIEPMLPGQDGFALCRAMKRGEFGAVPHVILGARIFRGQRYKAMAKDAGADIFLQRPDHDALLIKVLAQLCAPVLPTAAAEGAWQVPAIDPLQLEAELSQKLSETPIAGANQDDLDWDQFEAQFDQAFDGLTRTKSGDEVDPAAPLLEHSGRVSGREPTGPALDDSPAPRPHAAPAPRSELAATGPAGPPTGQATFAAAALAVDRIEALDSARAASPARPARPGGMPAAQVKAKRSPTIFIAAGLTVLAVVAAYVAYQYFVAAPDDAPVAATPPREGRRPDTRQEPPPTSDATSASTEAPTGPDPIGTAVPSGLGETAGSKQEPQTAPSGTASGTINGLPTGSPTGSSTGTSTGTTAGPAAVSPTNASPQGATTPPTPQPRASDPAQTPAAAKSGLPVRAPPRSASARTLESSTRATEPTLIARPERQRTSPEPTPSQRPANHGNDAATPEPVPPAPSDVDAVPAGPFTATIVLDDPAAGESAGPPGETQPQAEEPLRATGEVSAPRLIPSSRVEPAYPAIARQARRGGTVTLKLQIRTDGSVGGVEIVSDSAPQLGLGKAAIAAVKRWRYVPGTSQGVPVEMSQTVVLNFKP